jgi:hypothetical protein
MPADTYTWLNENTTSGDVMDESLVTYGAAPTDRKRPRVVLGGETAASIVLPINAAPAGTEYAVPVRQVGTITTDSSRPATGALSSVTAAMAATVLLATNANRLGAVIFNDSTATLYLGLSATDPTTSLFTFIVDPGDGYEIPFGYKGTIKGIWDAVNGAARITELT